MRHLAVLLSAVFGSAQPFAPASNPFCGTVPNPDPMRVYCASGVINSITAYFGLPTACPNITGGTCYSSAFQALANFTCLGKTSCTLTPCCGDPCPEHAKSVAVSATCSEAPGGWAPAPLCALSNVFGSHMVLQRSPQAPVLWGFAAPGASVETLFGGQVYSSIANGTGFWRLVLPPQEANVHGQTLNFTCSTGESFAIEDVLFGDVHLCGGQSNMQFAIDNLAFGDGFNATAEADAANAYPLVRTMTVGQVFTSSTPAVQLGAAPTLPWSVANASTIGAGNWTATSAACWYYGKQLFDALGVPVGLISSNWGGTPIESWSDNATNALCGPNSSRPVSVAHEAPSRLSTATLADGIVLPPYSGSGPNPISGNGVLFYAMISPFTVGPMPLTSVIWWQGESNILCQGGCKGWEYYGCQQNAMVSSWRRAFNNSELLFLYVPLEPWTGCCNVNTILPMFRELQDAALELPRVGYATAIDIADPTSPWTAIHPRNKKLIGERLSAAALTLYYNKSTPYLTPSIASSTAGANGLLLSVTVKLQDVPTKVVPAADHCKVELGVPANECGYPTIWGSDGRVYNATIVVGGDGKSVVLSANASVPDTTVAAHSYGFNTFPINLVYSAEGLPVKPWFVNVTATTWGPQDAPEGEMAAA